MADLCPRCGANLVLVGRVHRCIPRPANVPQAPVVKPASKPAVKPETPVVKPKTKQWRERDPEAYRAYMREYMRAHPRKRGKRASAD